MGVDSNGILPIFINIFTKMKNKLIIPGGSGFMGNAIASILQIKTGKSLFSLETLRIEQNLIFQKFNGMEKR